MQTGNKGAPATVIDLTEDTQASDSDNDDVIILPVYKIVDLSGQVHPYYDDCGCSVCEQHPYTMRAAGRYCECRKCNPKPKPKPKPVDGDY